MEIAQEIQPSKEARDSARGTSRMEIANWALAHEALVQQVAADKELVCAQAALQCMLLVALTQAGKAAFSWPAGCSAQATARQPHLYARVGL